MHASIVESPLGPLGIVWTDAGLSRVLLPVLDDEGEAMERLVKKHGRVGPLEGAGAAWAERLVGHLEGHDVPYDDLLLDQRELSPFAQKVYAAARRIPRGTTVTYAKLAESVGTGAARAIGVALGRNPTPIVVPCHRIVAAGSAGGFSAPGGLSTKAQLLAIEGGSIDDAEHSVARKHLARVDPALAPLVRSVPCRLPIAPSGNLFRTIVRAIAGQQLSTKAAATIFARLESTLEVEPASRWPEDVPSRVLTRSDSELRAVGLSNAKAASIRDLATRVTNGALDLERIVRLPDERVIDALTEVRGIGRWTAEMLLIFELGRPDVLPVDDLGIKKGLQKVHGLRALPDAPIILKRAEAWRPFRSIGSWYLWRALEATPA